MSGSRSLAQAGAVLALAAGVAIAWPALRRTDAAPSTERLIRWTGPLRGIPLPFLWAALGRAQRRYDADSIIAIGQWLTRFDPGREDLFLGFAYDLAYNAAALDRDPAARARKLADAVRMLDAGHELHPESAAIPARASFMLYDRATREDGGAELARAFREQYGRDPIELADRYLELANGIRPGVDWREWQQANLRQLRALHAWRDGERLVAGALMAEAAQLFRRTEPSRAAKLAELAVYLDTGRGLDDELAEWLSQDPWFGRHPELR